MYFSQIKELATLAVIAAAMGGIALGRLPYLTMNRAAMAVVAATALVAMGSLSLDQAIASIDVETLLLLFAMMLLVGTLRLSGFFALVAARLARLARNPDAFLLATVLVSGSMSALFLNDTMCLVLTPILTATCLSAGRDPIPYLVAVATAANVGSAATIIGNPQNMLIGAESGISFSAFFLKMAPAAAVGLAACYLVIRLVFARRLAPRPAAGSAPAEPPRPAAARVHPRVMAKAFVAGALMLAGFLAGLPVALAAMAAASLLLVTRRIKPGKLFAQVDYGLLAFFAGLFVITDAVTRTASWSWLESRVLDGAARSPWMFSGMTAAVSNLISNVPAVMVLGPSASAMADPSAGWLLLAMASTFAGNLTLVGSVANLIVAEGASAQGVRLSFWDYLKAGAPITLITLAAGTLFLL